MKSHDQSDSTTAAPVPRSLQFSERLVEDVAWIGIDEQVVPVTEGGRVMIVRFSSLPLPGRIQSGSTRNNAGGHLAEFRTKWIGMD